MKKGIGRIWREWLRSTLVLVLVVVSFRWAIADWNDVPTGSMKPTILEGDRIVVNKLAYDLRLPFTNWRIATWEDPARGDIVVLRSPADGMRLVKRVVGVPGDVLAMAGNRLILNGEVLRYRAVGETNISVFPWLEPGRVIANEDLSGSSHAVMLSTVGSSGQAFGPVLVPEGQYFVMGDNRDDSLDSRYFGFVPRELFIGRATAVAASIDADSSLRPRWDRFFQGLE